MDYAVPGKRKTKKDLQKKRKNRAYKRGGRFRGMDIKDKSKEEE